MTIQEIKEKAHDWPGTCIQALCDHVEALEKEIKTLETRLAMQRQAVREILKWMDLTQSELEESGISR